MYSQASYCWTGRAFAGVPRCRPRCRRRLTRPSRHTWVFCSSTPPPDPESAPKTLSHLNLQFTLDKHTRCMVPSRVLSRTNLAYSPLTPALSPRVSEICGLFNSLCALFSPPVVCFQQLADSFCKTPRGGGYAQKLAFRISDFQTLSCPERGMRRVPHPGGTFVATEHPAKDANPERPSGVEGSQPRRSPSAPAPRSLRLAVIICLDFVRPLFSYSSVLLFPQF